MIPDFLYIGHRGSRVNVDENTISAFKRALEFGANCIEFDVRKTADGELVILHDSTLDRTTNGSGLLNEFTLAEIKEFKTKTQNTTIPSLTDVFDEFKGKLKFMIELKESNLQKELSEILREYELFKDCIISGRILIDILEFKNLFPQCRICYNITKGQGISLDKFMNSSNDEKISLKLDLINLQSRLVSKEFLEVCHKNKIKVLSWDFLNNNPLQKIKALINLGLDGILFDNHSNIPQVKSWQSHF